MRRKGTFFFFKVLVNMLRIGTDCSGIEAPIEAIKKISSKYKINFKHMFSSEIDKFAIKYIKENHDPDFLFNDIKNRNIDDVPNIDIYVAGFPCQPCSHIGKREGFEHPTQGTMFHEILRIIEHKKTRVVFLENVPGLVTHDKGQTLAIILDELTNLGYKCHTTILNSSDFRVPQNRQRFYLVGFLDDVDFSFPEPPGQKVNIGDYLESNVSGFSISKHLQKSYLFKKDDGSPNLIDNNTKGPIKTLVSTYHKIQRLTGTFVRDGETGLRLLTTNECKSVMGFPEDFVIPVSRTQMYRQMGNSVVISVIEAIAKEIVSSMELFDEGSSKVNQKYSN